MRLNINRTQITQAQILKITAPVLAILAFIMSLIDVKTDFFYLTRPCALYQIYDMVILASTALFLVVLTLPMKLRFKNTAYNKKIILPFLLITTFSSFGKLFIEALVTDYFIFNFQKGSHCLNYILLATFYIFLFVKEVADKHHIRAGIFISGMTYILSTIGMYYYSYNDIHMGFKTIALMVDVLILMLYECIFFDLNEAFLFSTLRNLKLSPLNGNEKRKPDKLPFAHVIGFVWKKTHLHILLYTSKDMFLDCAYEPLENEMIADEVSFENDTDDEFLIPALNYRVYREIYGYTRL